jgi:glucose uptake protein
MEGDISTAGMAIAFPIGIGIALVLEMIINYQASPQGNVPALFVGVTLITLAIDFDAIGYKKRASQSPKVPAKGIVLPLIGGMLMAFLCRFVARSKATNPE